MSITVLIPDSLARFCDGQRSIEADGTSLAGVMADLVARYPELETRLLDQGRLRSHLMVFHNGNSVPRDMIADLGLADGDELSLVFLAGGG